LVLLATAGGVYAVVDFVGSEESFAFACASIRKGGHPSSLFYRLCSGSDGLVSYGKSG
jgi:hypothetical protein